MAIPVGVEPTTYEVEARCSIQLSYGTVIVTNLDHKHIHLLLRHTIQHMVYILYRIPSYAFHIAYRERTK